jgi:hypothetical protein
LSRQATVRSVTSMTGRQPLCSSPFIIFH